MKWRSVQGGWVVVVERGDDVLACLRQVATEAGILAGAISGLGAIDGVRLARWDTERKEYVHTDFQGDREIGALTGNLTMLDGNPFPHVHAVIGGRDCIAHAGHLMAARCAATVEIFIHDYASEIVRGPDPVIGLNLCKL